jgi:hypothetical protein
VRRTPRATRPETAVPLGDALGLDPAALMRVPRESDGARSEHDGTKLDELS